MLEIELMCEKTKIDDGVGTVEIDWSKVPSREQMKAILDRKSVDKATKQVAEAEGKKVPFSDS